MTAISETLKALPPEARQAVIDFAEFLVQKYQKNETKTYDKKKEIMSFAGSWKNMKEEEFQGFLNEIRERREKSSNRRRHI